MGFDAICNITLAQAHNSDLFDTGIYTVGDIAKLTRVPVRHVQRWMKGYSYSVKSGKTRQAPLWSPELPQHDRQLVLSFNDLVEIFAVDKFTQAGVLLPKIRAAIEEFSNEGVPYPFSNEHIITDGRALYKKLMEDGEEVRDNLSRPIIVEVGGKKQLVSYDIILTSIVKNLGFENELVAYFYPDREKYRKIVVDPRRAFGHPTIAGTRLEVEVIAMAHKSHPSIELVAEWFGIEKDAVSDAVSFHELYYAA